MASRVCRLTVSGSFCWNGGSKELAAHHQRSHQYHDRATGHAHSNRRSHVRHSRSARRRPVQMQILSAAQRNHGTERCRGRSGTLGWIKLIEPTERDVVASRPATGLPTSRDSAPARFAALCCRPDRPSANEDPERSSTPRPGFATPASNRSCRSRPWTCRAGRH